jgi:hypothetical protein
MTFLTNRSFLRQEDANFCSCCHKMYNRGKWNYYSIKTNLFKKRRVLEERSNGEPDPFSPGPAGLTHSRQSFQEQPIRPDANSLYDS